MPEIPATLPPERKPSILVTLLRPKVAIPVSLVVLLLLSPLIIRGWSLRGVPDIPEPFDAEPLLSLEIPAEENAFVEYRQAAAVYIDPSMHVSELRDKISEEGWHLADDDVRQFLHDNENALLTWKRGSEKAKTQYVHARDYHISTDLNVVQDIREFQRTVMLLGRKLEAEGRYEEAWEWYRASDRASRHAGRNGSAIERLVGVACFAIVAERLEDWAAHPDVSRKLLHRAVEELQEDWELTEQNSTIWKIGYLWFLKTIAQGESGQLDWNIFKGRRHWNLPINSNTLYLMGETKLSRSLARILTDNQLRYCDLMPFERPNFSPGMIVLYETGNPLDISPEAFESAMERSYLAGPLLPFTHQTQQLFDRDEIRYRTLLVTLAGQVFYRDHQRFPKQLDELVPEYIASIPIDIYDGSPLKYRFDPTGPVVYSVFVNRTDEGGLEWTTDQSTRAGKIRPDDFGFQMKLPRIKPLRAEKPVDLIEEEGYLEYSGSDVEVP